MLSVPHHPILAHYRPALSVLSSTFSMTHFTQDQLVAALAALGISPPHAEAPVRPDTHGNTLAEAATGALHSFFCYNCSHPNVIPVSAIPTMTAVPLARSRNPVPPVSAAATRDSSSPTQALTTHCPIVAPIAQRAPVASSSAVPSGPLPQNSADVQPVGVAAGTLSVGPASFSTSPTVRPDGPWYVVSKGRSVGVFKGWQNVSSLVTGVGRACFFRHPSRALALAAFNEALANGSVEIL
ncbi:uncharacterized protein ARMOST_17399 [Armillaria ostoyae]|uniref:Ribonuclease H1 N-terminal domain-containing protein n=1 Tax=Armillaria ostoyae TaxID=47428 RepID=A0A284RYW2_ARMOS|nr:uncharacterized protein ARMOST_17399 [Armillaria ostoyae]